MLPCRWLPMHKMGPRKQKPFCGGANENTGMKPLCLCALDTGEGLLSSVPKYLLCNVITQYARGEDVSSGCYPLFSASGVRL